MAASEFLASLFLSRRHFHLPTGVREFSGDRERARTAARWAQNNCALAVWQTE